MNQDNLFKAYNCWWELGTLYDLDFGTPYPGFTGPYCYSCFVTLTLTTQTKDQIFGTCPKCSKKYKFDESLREMRDKVLDLFNAESRSRKDKFSLDSPPTRLSVRDSDNKYFIAAKIGEKDGKHVGIVYFGEKKSEQSNEDYTQIFIDLEDEQLRFDKSNKHPKEILLKFVAEFPNTTNTQLFDKK